MKYMSLLRISHRGGSALYSENTLEAFDASLRFDIDGVECDIHLTSDGVPIVFHDDTLERCTNGHGRTAECSLEQLRQLRISDRFRPGTSYLIPTLDETLSLLSNRNNAHLFLEIKYKKSPDGTKSTYQMIAEKTLQALKSSKMLTCTTIISFDWNVLFQVRALDKTISLGLLASSKEFDLSTNDQLNSLLDKAKQIGCQWLDLDARYFPIETLERNQYLINAMKQSGFRVGLWTVNDYNDMRRFIDLGIDAITSDHPELLALL